jgi:Holliday junction resolvase
MPGTDAKDPLHRSVMQQGRAAQHLAIRILREKGCLAVRAVGSQSLVHIIAWRERDCPIYIRIKRARRSAAGASEVVSRWSHDITQLRNLLKTIGGSVQFWVYSRKMGWQFYEVLPGGIAEVSEPTGSPFR